MNLFRPGRLTALLLTIACVAPACASAGTYTWDLEQDMATGPSHSNPNGDAYGDGATWGYKQSIGTTPNPLLYSALGAYTTQPYSSVADGAVVGWTGSGTDAADGSAVPSVLKNIGGVNRTYRGSLLPAGKVVLTPDASRLAIVAWTAPATGTYHVDGTVTDLNADCGDGVHWYVQRGSSTLADAQLANGGAPQTMSAAVSGGASLANVAMSAGDVLYFVVAPGLTAGCDTTGLSPVITLADSAAPAPTLTAPATTTAAAKPSFSGTAGNGFGDVATVHVDVWSGTDTSGAPLQTLTTTRNGASFSIDATSTLGDGTYTAIASQDDQAGNSGHSTPRTFRVDTTAPSVTLDSTPSTPTNDNTPTFGGTGGLATGDSATVSLKLWTGTTATGSPAQTLTATRDAGTGAWSTTVPGGSALADGTYTARAVQSDSVGNTASTQAFTFTVDTAAPAPAVSSPTAASTQTTATPTISGSAGNATGDDATVTVKLYAGASATGSPAQTLTPARSGATFTATPATLSDGQWTVTVSQGDAAGNSATSSPVTFSVDTSGPALSLNQPTTPSTNATPTFAGTASILPGDSLTVTVKVYAGTSASGTPAQTLTTARDAFTGAYSTSPLALADGTYTAQAEQTDGASNSGHSPARTFRVDLNDPTPDLSTPADGSRVADATPTIAGTAGTATGDETQVTAQVFAGATATGTPLQSIRVSTGAGGAYTSHLASLADGVYTVRVQQADDVAHTGTSPTHTFAIDTVAPTVTLDGPATPGHDDTPPLSGTASTDAQDAATVSVRIYSGATATGAPIATVSGIARDAGTGAWSTAAPQLADGTYTARAEQTDTAGNTGHSADATFRVDTTAPAPALSTPDDTTATNDTTPTFAGTAGTATGDASAVSVEISDAGGVVQTLATTADGAGAFTVDAATPLPEGTYSARALQSDSAGNDGIGPATTFTVDTTAPTVALDAPADGGRTSSSDITGTRGTADGDGSVTVEIWQGTSAVGQPDQTRATRATGADHWQATGADLPEGTYTVRAIQPDAANNTAHSATRTFTIDRTAPALSLDAPASGADRAHPVFGGQAGTAAGDDATVTIRVYAGTATDGTPAQTLTATRDAGTGAYSATPATALADGTYTAVAEQADSAANSRTSTARTFTIAAPPVITPPHTDPPRTDPPVTPPALTGTLAPAGGQGLAAIVRAGTLALATTVNRASAVHIVLAIPAPTAGKLALRGLSTTSNGMTIMAQKTVNLATGTTRVSVRFPARVRRAIKSLRSLRVAYDMTVTDANGATTHTTGRIRLARTNATTM